MEPYTYYGEEPSPGRGNRKLILGLVLGLILGIAIGGGVGGLISQKLELNIDSPIAMVVMSNAVFVILVVIIITVKVRKANDMGGELAPSRAIILSIVLGLTVLLGLGMVFYMNLR